MKTLSNHISTGFKKNSGIYFPNLNALRFFAALMVFVCHTESAKENFYLPNGLHNYFFTLIGKLGVVLFFVLSGFLITFLLLKEDVETKKIALKKFYLRRMLRIWPIYFLLVAFSFFAGPKFHFFYMPNFESALLKHDILPNFLMHLLIFPNLAISMYGAIPYAGQLWSIGTEEQFYLLWPLLIKKFKNKLWLFVGVFIAYSAVKLILLVLAKYSPLAKIILGFWYYFNIDCMAIGAIAAYLIIYNKQKILSVIYSKTVQFSTYLILIILIANSYQFKLLHYELYGALFAIVILNLGCNNNSIINLENSILNFLGKISYGIYMYHFIALTIAIRILQHYDFVKSFAIYVLAFLITVLLSSLSYYCFENYFLKWKERYVIFKN